MQNSKQSMQVYGVALHAIVKYIANRAEYGSYRITKYGGMHKMVVALPTYALGAKAFISQMNNIIRSLYILVPRHILLLFTLTTIQLDLLTPCKVGLSFIPRLCPCMRA